MDAYIGRRELGALSRRALGMDCTLGLDLGGRSAVGIRTLPPFTMLATRFLLAGALLYPARLPLAARVRPCHAGPNVKAG